MSDLKKFHPGFSKDVEAVCAVYQLGGITWKEWRENLRKAGMALDENSDALPKINLTPFGIGADEYEEATVE